MFNEKTCGKAHRVAICEDEMKNKKEYEKFCCGSIRLDIYTTYLYRNIHTIQIYIHAYTGNIYRVHTHTYTYIELYKLEYILYTIATRITTTLRLIEMNF